MKKVLALVLCAAVMTTWSTVSAADDTAKAQSKLLAQRAARVDAIRKLSEQINGLFISSKTTVKDFIAESDTIRTAMQGWLNGMKETDVKYMEDGTCEVTMEVTLVTVIEELKQLSARYYKGDKFKAVDFAEMTRTNEAKVIKAVGNGAPRPIAPVGEFVATGAGGATGSAGGLPEGMSAKAADYWMGPKGADGMRSGGAVLPNKRLMAVRAAELDGKRKLAERINGLYIASQTQVKDFIAESDWIKTVSESILRGVRTKAIRYHESEPIVEVEQEVTLRTVYETVKSLYEAKYKGDKAKIVDFEERIQTVKDTVISEVGMGVAETQQPVEIVAVAENLKKWPLVIQAVGNAAIDKSNDNAAQAKLMAFRGATIDGYRKLAEQIDGLMITSKTSVKDFVAMNDEIKTAMATFMQGVRPIEDSKKVMEDGTVEITVEIDPEPLWDIVVYYQKKLSITLK